MFRSIAHSGHLWKDTMNIEEFIVLEDDQVCMNEIQHELRRQGCEVIKLTRTKTEAERMIRPGENQVFILDNDLGARHESDGYLAALTVRERNPEAFVGILSRHGGPRLVRNAERAGITFVPKSLGDITKDVQNILIKAVKFYRNNLLEKVEQLDFVIDEVESQLPTEVTINNKRYLDCISDEEWFEKHKGLYVAFVDGEYVQSCENEEDLIRNMENQYPGHVILVVKAGEDIREIDIPTIFFDE